MKQEFKKYLLLVGILIIAGCDSWQISKPGEPVGESLNWHVMSKSFLSVTEGEFGFSFEMTQRRLQLLTSESQGLLLIDEEGLVSKLRSSVELLDVRKSFILGETESVVGISYDQDNQELFLFSVRPGNSRESLQLEELATLRVAQLEVDSVCLYQDGADNLFAFILDEQGNASQYLLADGASNSVVIRNIRDFNVAPGGIACTVDDVSQRLFVLEENMGIWSYNAEPEAELGRKPFQLFAPYGKALASASGMDIVSGHLAVISPEEKELVLFSVDSGEPFERISLSTFLEPESVTLSEISSTRAGFAITIFDAATDSYHSTDIKIPVGQSKEPETIRTVSPQIETAAMGLHGDVADDPAIWINAVDHDKSLVLGTNKKSGLHVYDMKGHEQQFFPTGRLNNVDVRNGFLVADKPMSIATASNRSNNSISLFAIDPSARVTYLGDIATGMAEVYGLCSYKDVNGKLNVFINDKDGTVQQWLIAFATNGKPNGELARQFKLNSQPEGCVASDKTRRLFIGEEDVGIWTLGAEADSKESLQKVLNVNELDASSRLFADAEGVALYETDSRSYLIVSSQGNDSYLVLDAKPPYNLKGRFRIAMNVVLGIDGASETDGLDVTSVAMSGAFSEGFLVVQDGRNVMPKEGQNFKYVSWRDIKNLLDL
ncbi:MAG: phytase [Pseudomonadales bacterium]|nr:phytase [Pseudomonadales bacterium]